MYSGIEDSLRMDHSLHRDKLKSRRRLSLQRQLFSLFLEIFSNLFSFQTSGWNLSNSTSLGTPIRYSLCFFGCRKESSSKIIGRVEIPVTLVASRPNESFDCWFKLLEVKGKNDIGTPGFVRLILRFAQVSIDPQSSPQVMPVQMPIENPIQAPQTNPRKPTQEAIVPPQFIQQPQKDPKVAVCPVCETAISLDIIQQHINKCLEKQQQPSPPHRLPAQPQFTQQPQFPQHPPQYQIQYPQYQPQNPQQPRYLLYPMYTPQDVAHPQAKPT